MADVATVVRLLERWRDAGTVERVRVAVDATREIRGLSPERKRALAAEVAERVAPQLVPQIRAEQGDLSPEQVTAVVDLLRRADREQVDDLVRALKEGDVDPALALADGALDAVDPPTPPRSSAASDGTDRRPFVADVGGAAGAGAAAAGATRDAPSGTVDELVAAARAEADEAPDLAVLDSVPDEQELREEAEERAEAARDRWRDSSPAPAAMEPLDLDFSTSFRLTSADLPDTTVETVPTLLERPRRTADDDAEPEAVAAVPVGEADRDVPLRAGRHVAAEEPDVLAGVLAAPDGYRRRRAAVAAVREGRLLAPGTVHAVVARLARTTDRTWVAGAALDAGLLDEDDLDALPLRPSARARLAARLDRRGG